MNGHKKAAPPFLRDTEEVAKYAASAKGQQLLMRLLSSLIEILATLLLRIFR